MCFFTSSVDDVSDSRIFVRKDGARSQVIAYQMTLVAEGELAMVLPLPIGERDEAKALEFISMEHCAGFFRWLSKALTIWEDDEVSMGAGLMDLDSAPARPTLAVRHVGDYEASFVPSIGDFDRLDARFRLPPEVWRQCEAYRDWGFAVFKLRDFAAGARSRHPMAFRFVTRYPDSLFVPTTHVHDGQVHRLADFDHQIYFQAGEDFEVEPRAFKYGRRTYDEKDSLAARRFRYRPLASRGSVPPFYGILQPSYSNEMKRFGSKFSADMRPPDGLLEPDLLVQAFGLRGSLPNQDFWLDLQPGCVRESSVLDPETLA